MNVDLWRSHVNVELPRPGRNKQMSKASTMRYTVLGLITIGAVAGAGALVFAFISMHT